MGLRRERYEGMLDGHVVWVPFNQMIPRCGDCGGANPISTIDADYILCFGF